VAPDQRRRFWVAHPVGRAVTLPLRRIWTTLTACRSRAAWSLGLLSAGFAVLGAVVAFLGDDATARDRLYTGTPEFKVWAALIIGIVAALPAAWRVGIDLLRRLGLDPRRVLRSWAAPILAAVLLVAAAAVLGGRYLSGYRVSGYQGSLRITVIYLLGLAAAAPAFAAMWECYRQLADDDDGASGRQPDAEITRLLLLRECLLSALTTLGLLVSAGVLATGAQRQAVLANPRYGVSYPPAYVLIWGLGFSALLLVNFLPAFRRLTRLARVIIDRILPLQFPGSDRWQGRLQERKDLADLLKVTSSTKDVITSAILVAGPLISGAFSLFLPGS
jgi:hypothetical protein